MGAGSGTGEPSVKIRIDVPNIKSLKDLVAWMRKLGVEVDDSKNKLEKWFSTVEKNVSKVMQWAVACGIVYKSLRALGTAARDIKEVEYAMSGLTKVMRNGIYLAGSMRAGLMDLAETYGETTTSVIEAATEWARLQLSTNTILEATRASLLAQAVAEMSAADATRYLIAAQKQFGLSARSALLTLDAWNELSNTFAVRAIDLATATGRAGKVMDVTGTSMQRLLGYTTALVQATGRAGSEVGNALRTMGTYAYRTETIAKLSKVAGVAVQDLAGRHKAFGDILTELAIRWDTYTDAQRKQIAQTMAGTRQANMFLSLMEQYDVALEATITAWKSLGSAQREADIRLDTTRKRLEALRSALTKFVVSISDPGLKVFKSFVSVLTQIINGLTVMKAVVSALIPLLLSLALTSKKVTTAIVALSSTLLSFAMAHPVLLALTVAFVGLSYAVGRYKKHVDEAKRAQESLIDSATNDINAKIEQANRIDYLIKRYETLGKALEDAQKGTVSLSKEQALLLKSQQESIASVLAKYAGMDAADFSKNTVEALDKVKRKQREMMTDARLSARGVAEDTRKMMDDINEQVRILSVYIEEINKIPAKAVLRYRQALEQTATVLNIPVEDLWKIKAIRKTLTSETIVPPFIQTEKTNKKVLEQLEDAVKALNEEYTELLKKYNQLVDITTPGVFEDEAITAEELKRILRELANELSRIGEQYSHLAEMADIEGKKRSEQYKIIRNGIQEQIALVTKLQGKYSSDVELVEQLEQKLEELNLSLETVNNNIKEATFSEAIDKARESFDNLSYAIDMTLKYAQAYNKLTNDSVALEEAEINALEGQLSAAKQYKSELQRMGVVTKDVDGKIKSLEDSLALARYTLENVTRPMKAYTDAMREFEMKTEIEDVWLDISGANEVAKATETVLRAREKLRIANEKGTEEQKKSAEHELKVAELLLQLAQLNKTLAERTKEYNDRVNELNDDYADQIALMDAYGASVSEQLEKEEEFLNTVLKLAAAFGMEAEELENIKRRLREVGREMKVASIEERLEMRSRALEALRNEESRRLDILRAMGADEIELAQKQIDALMRERDAIAAIYSGFSEEMEKALDDVNERILDANVNLTTAIINNQREFASQWVDIMEDTRDSIAELMTDIITQPKDALDAIYSYMENLRRMIILNFVRTHFDEYIEKLTGWQLGITKEYERLRADEERRRKEIDALMFGGNFIANEMRRAGVDVAAMISTAMRTAEVTVVPQQALPPAGNVPAAIGGNIGTGTAVALTATSAVPYIRGVRERGGGARFLGFAAGTAIGAYFGGPTGAVIGGQAGATVVTIGQEIIRMIKNEERKTPRRTAAEEPIQTQLGELISRGSFREAANITYNVQQTISLDFMIPDAVQLRRVIEILNREGANFNRNVNVS